MLLNYRFGMSEILNKSRQNEAASSLLIRNYFYASSIHCIYYSCFQKLLFLVRRHGYENEESWYLSKDKKKGSHNRTIGSFLSLMRDKGVDGVLSMDREIQSLKRDRGLADYEEAKITEKIVHVCMDRAHKINSIINKGFGNEIE